MNRIEKGSLLVLAIIVAFNIFFGLGSIPLLDPDELEAVEIMRKAYNGMRADEAVENILNMFARTKNNKEYIAMVKKNRII